MMWPPILLSGSTLLGVALLAFVITVRHRRIDLGTKAWRWVLVLSTIFWATLVSTILIDNRVGWVVPTMLFFFVAFNAKGGYDRSLAADEARTTMPEPLIIFQPGPNADFLRRLEFVVRLEDHLLIHAQVNGDRCLIRLDSDVMLLGEITQLADDHKCEITSADAIDARRAA